MTYWNKALFQFIHGFAGRSHFLDIVGFILADRLTYLLALTAIIFILLNPGWKKRFFVAAEMSLAFILARGIITEAIRFFYSHPRPFVALNFQPLFPESATNSMPSGHMTALFALALVMFLHNRKWGTWFMIASLVLGIGRIYAGVHWPLDILVGIIIGSLSGIFIHRLSRPYWAKMSAAKVPSDNLQVESSL